MSVTTLSPAAFNTVGKVGATDIHWDMKGRGMVLRCPAIRRAHMYMHVALPASMNTVVLGTVCSGEEEMKHCLPGLSLGSVFCVLMLGFKV